MMFKEWIAKYKGKDAAIGDLADDVILDENFPDSNDHAEMYEYMAGVSCNTDVLRTFREAWATYVRSTGLKQLSEAAIEHTFGKRIEKLGGLSLKFTPSGWAGAPDRIVLLPSGVVYFVEFKVLGAEPRPLQKYRLVSLFNLGFERRIFVIDSMRDIEAFIEMVSDEHDLPRSDESEFKIEDYDDKEWLFRV